MPLYANSVDSAKRNIFIDSLYKREEAMLHADMLEQRAKDSGEAVSSADLCAYYRSAFFYLNQAVEHLLAISKNPVLNDESKQDQIYARIWLVKELPWITYTMNELSSKLRMQGYPDAEKITQTMVKHVVDIDDIARSILCICSIKVLTKLPTEVEEKMLQGNYILLKTQHDEFSVRYVKVNLSGDERILIEAVPITDSQLFSRTLLEINNGNMVAEDQIIQLTGRQINQLITLNGGHDPISSEFQKELNELNRELGRKPHKEPGKNRKITERYYRLFINYLQKIAAHTTFITSYCDNEPLQILTKGHYGKLHNSGLDHILPELTKIWTKFENATDRVVFINQQYEFLSTNIKQSIALLRAWDRKTQLEKIIAEFNVLIRKVKERLKHAIKNLPSTLNKVLAFLRDSLFGGLGILLFPVFIPACFLIDLFSKKHTLQSYLEYTIKSKKAWLGLAVISVVAVSAIVPILHPLVPTLLAISSPVEIGAAVTATAVTMQIQHQREISHLNAQHQNEIAILKGVISRQASKSALEYEAESQTKKERSEREKKMSAKLAAAFSGLDNSSSDEDSTTIMPAPAEPQQEVDQASGKASITTALDGILENINEDDAKGLLSELTNVLAETTSSLDNTLEILRKNSLIQNKNMADEIARRCRWQEIKSRLPQPTNDDPEVTSDEEEPDTATPVKLGYKQAHSHLIFAVNMQDTRMLQPDDQAPRLSSQVGGYE